jgi:hypothetical protein
LKNFLYRLLVFVSLPVIYFGSNCAINYLIYKDQSINLKSSRILIVGDSHMQKGLDPSFFNNAQNISQPAEPYVITFWKVKKVLQEFSPDTILIGFAPHNVSTFNDLKFTDQLWSQEMFRRTYPIQSFSKINKQIKVDYMTYYLTLWKEIAFYPKRDHIHFIGNYSNKALSKINDAHSTIDRHYYINGAKCKISSNAVNYLDSILTICKEKKIVAILVNTPVHKSYYSKIPTDILGDYKHLKDNYILSVTVIDAMKQEYPDSLFLNCDHLNSLGALKFTDEIIKFLNLHS